MRRFDLYRHHDVSGITGERKVVARGCEFDQGGYVSLQWLDSPNPIPEPYPNMAALLAIHGHHGATTAEWIDVYRPVPVPRNWVVNP